MKKTATKPARNGNRTAAYLIGLGIEALRENPAERKMLGIDLLDLQLAETVKRRLLREKKQ